jgi:propionyl-CoA synthetase
MPLHSNFRETYLQRKRSFWAASDMGWAVDTAILYGPLINRNTTIVFEGKPSKHLMPARRIISEHKVGTMFTHPTAIRAIKKRRSWREFIKQYDLSCLKINCRRTPHDNATLECIKNTPDSRNHWWRNRIWLPDCQPLESKNACQIWFGYKSSYDIDFQWNGQELGPKKRRSPHPEIY